MHIILVSDRLATAKTIVLTARHLMLALAVLLAAVIGLSSLFSYVTVRHAADIRIPFVQDVLKAVSAEETRASREFVRENLNAMAVRLGQMQAQMLRLDSIGERLANLAGVKFNDLQHPEPARDGRGGPLVAASSFSSDDLARQLDSVAHQLDAKSDALTLLENQLLDERIRKSLLPTSLPIEQTWNASSFGWRIDPITGEQAMHEGVDFIADTGTPIKAAAAGVVIDVERHPAYGNVVDIDHGNDLVTRYAHASKVLVQQGALVKRGQVIGEVGSTGRSTGPHLHFEVRIKGAATNPNRFLQMANAGGQKVASHQH